MPSFSIDPRNNVKSSMRKLKRQASDMNKMNKPMKKISIWLDGWVQRNFKSQGGKVGGWPRLKAGGRRIKGGGFDPQAKVLQDTGRLKASFLPFSTNTNAGIGSELPYSKTHNNGLKGMKKRRMIPDNSDHDVSIFVAKMLSQHIKKVFNK